MVPITPLSFGVNEVLGGMPRFVYIVTNIAVTSLTRHLPLFNKEASFKSRSKVAFLNLRNV